MHVLCTKNEPMRFLTTFTLPIITFSTLLAVVACGPSKNSTTVKFEGESGFSKAVANCQGELKSSQKQVVERTVKLCRVPDASADGVGNGTGADRTVKPKAELVDQPYFYEVSKGEDKEKKRSRLQVRFRVGLVLPSGLTEKDENTVLEQMRAACGADLGEFYKRSTRRVPVQINAAYFIVSKTPSASVENYNELALAQTAGDSSYPGYEMTAFLGGAKFYPVGEATEKKRCGSISGPATSKQKCEYDAFLSSNRRFCRQLAKMTGVWLGLADEATERKACGLPEAGPGAGAGAGAGAASSATAGASAEAPESAVGTTLGASAEAPKSGNVASDAKNGTLASAPTAGSESAVAGAAKEPAKAKRSGKSNFMKTASEQDPAEFFKTAALSNEDLATVLSDSCAGLSQMLAPTPTPPPSPSATPESKTP